MISEIKDLDYISQSGTKSSEMHNWPTRVPPPFTIWSHLVGHTAQHCWLTKTQLAVTDCVWLSHGGGCVGKEWTDPSWHLAPPWPPLWPGPLVLGALAGASYSRPLPLICSPHQSVQHSRGRALVQVLGQDQRLPVLLLGDGKHRHTDVITLAWEITPLYGLATLNLTLGGGRRARAGLWGGSLGLRNPRGLHWVCCPREQAKARPCEAWAPQVAGGVETPLPLGRLRKWVGGIADGWVRDGAVVCPGLQVNIREDLPAVASPAVSCQTGWSLQRYETVCSLQFFTMDRLSWYESTGVIMLMQLHLSVSVSQHAQY